MVQFRNDCEILQFGKDYHKIRSFLIELKKPNWLFGRWDWMITHIMLDPAGIPGIGVWEDDGRIVALAIYDTELGKGYCHLADGYGYLTVDVLSYSSKAFAKDGKYAVLIGDDDQHFQAVAAEQGYEAIADKEEEAIFEIGADALDYALPAGFSIRSLDQDLDLYRYGKVLWKGFNHELKGEGPYNPSTGDLEKLQREMVRPNVDLSLKIAVANPQGEFVAYCGMWHDRKCDYCLVEPVATDPDYRRQGLGRAAVLEGIRRCGLLGAKQAIVGSSQQFYYRIGFRPFTSSTWWRRQA